MVCSKDGAEWEIYSYKCFKKRRKFKISDRIFHLLQLEKDESFICKFSKRMEIIKIADIKNTWIYFLNK